MSVATEWASFKTPAKKEIAPVPEVGTKAPVNENLKLPADKPTIIVFLRHCGCPFAEKTFKDLTTLSNRHPEIHFVAVSHSSPEATEYWVVTVGGNWDVEVVIDEQRDLYSQFGLGVSTTWHVMNPATLVKAMRLAKDENIWNRPTGQSGSRWQTSGAFAVDVGGTVRWRQVARSADDVPDLDAAVQSLGVTPFPKPPPEVRTEGFL
ncbi:Uu.00g080730.m01.CDS01 [Anthostomella pinea]|uniref:Uu.00g080730.m01.CDS01 n=1 Tax=Anthostomella pinea TaxID=933095 RepID=A0AAI8YJD3_9PEZI|nr:Uu.00g080730.m01.CDS01 [Anthostomella pinea]